MLRAPADGVAARAPRGAAGNGGRGGAAGGGAGAGGTTGAAGTGGRGGAAGGAAGASGTAGNAGTGGGAGTTGAAGTGGAAGAGSGGRGGTTGNAGTGGGAGTTGVAGASGTGGGVAGTGGAAGAGGAAGTGGAAGAGGAPSGPPSLTQCIEYDHNAVNNLPCNTHERLRRLVGQLGHLAPQRSAGRNRGAGRAREDWRLQGKTLVAEGHVIVASWNTYAEFSPTGSMLAVGSRNGVEIYRTSDWTLQTTLPGTVGDIYGLAWTGAGEVIS